MESGGRAQEVRGKEDPHAVRLLRKKMEVGDTTVQDMDVAAFNDIVRIAL